MANETLDSIRAETIERIRAYVQLSGVTKKGLAEDAGLHPNTLIGMEDSGWNPTLKTLMALEAQLPPAHETEAPPSQAAA